MNQVTTFRAKKCVALDAMKGALKQLSLDEALEVTGQLLVELSTSEPTQVKRTSIRASASVLQPRKAGGKHSVEKDPELEAFILSLRGFRTIADIRTACVKKFGNKRVPSKSSLHRYIQKLQYRQNEEL
ncbi:hypothetical protein [Neptuniibacter marinus]|jgi:anthranilate phosphoribosyltransferase|uniref:hypothetical protein n=1 Tax=Neptuniibacter marinus TaxID=1806670 RepID=UPI0008375CD9|nr:hypothetical protein [Neptuniibacter marinus]